VVRSILALTILSCFIADMDFNMRIDITRLVFKRLERAVHVVGVAHSSSLGPPRTGP
jgi:hypothetical protein